MEVEQGYKAISGRTRTYPAANNQADFFVLQCHLSCRNWLFQIILVQGLGLSRTWDWLYASIQEILAQHWISSISLNSASHFLTSFKEKGECSNHRMQNTKMKITLCEGGRRWEIYCYLRWVSNFPSCQQPGKSLCASLPLPVKTSTMLDRSCFSLTSSVGRASKRKSKGSF